MIFNVYIIHNILNNKVYIGKTKNLQKRWKKHIKIALGKRIVEKFFIHKAIAKYGVNNFTFSILQSFHNENDCSAAEIYWINFFKSKFKNYGYNLTAGGEGCNGRMVSNETRKKQSIKAFGRKHTLETIEKLKLINIGKIPSNLEQLKKINIGKKLSLKHKQKISKARDGIVFTKEHKENISKSHIGLFSGNKNPFYGKTHTENVKEKSRGENNKQSKLKSKQVIEMREKYNLGNYTHQQLANEYGVSRRAVTHIINYTTWRHIK